MKRSIPGNFDSQPTSIPPTPLTPPTTPPYTPPPTIRRNSPPPVRIIGAPKTSTATREVIDLTQCNSDSEDDRPLLFPSYSSYEEEVSDSEDIPTVEKDEIRRSCFVKNPNLKLSPGEWRRRAKTWPASSSSDSSTEEY